MKAVKAYVDGLTSVLSHKKMSFVLYFVNIMFAVLLVAPVFQLLSNGFSNSMEVNKLLERFDYTIIGDFINEHETLLSTALNYSIYLFLAYIIINEFLLAGAITVFNKKFGEIFQDNFWKGGAHFFWRFLRLSIYFILVHIFLIFIMSKLFVELSNGLSPFEMESELELIHAVKILLPIYMLCFLIIKCVHDFCRISLVRTNEFFLIKSNISAIKYVSRNFLSILLLLFINVTIFLILYAIYYFLKNAFDGSAGISLLIVFIFGQVFLVLRIVLRLTYFASLNALYQE